MKSRRRDRSPIEQPNLFHPKRDRPVWEMLPLEVRKEVTKLVAQMLSARQARHVDPAEGAAGEVQHD